MPGRAHARLLRQLHRPPPQYPDSSPFVWSERSVDIGGQHVLAAGTSFTVIPPGVHECNADHVAHVEEMLEVR